METPPGAHANPLVPCLLLSTGARFRKAAMNPEAANAKLLLPRERRGAVLEPRGCSSGNPASPADSPDPGESPRKRLTLSSDWGLAYFHFLPLQVLLTVCQKSNVYFGHETELFDVLLSHKGYHAQLQRIILHFQCTWTLLCDCHKLPKQGIILWVWAAQRNAQHSGISKERKPIKANRKNGFGDK